MILIDLQKAFDTIDHKILTEKMSCLGFAESTIRWYKSYLTNRCFIVNVGNDFSSPGNNTKRSHTQLDSRKQVIAFQDRVMTINIKEAQHPLK